MTLFSLLHRLDESLLFTFLWHLRFFLNSFYPICNICWISTFQSKLLDSLSLGTMFILFTALSPLLSTSHSYYILGTQQVFVKWMDGMGQIEEKVFHECVEIQPDATMWGTKEFTKTSHLPCLGGRREWKPSSVDICKEALSFGVSLINSWGTLVKWAFSKGRSSALKLME